MSEHVRNLACKSENPPQEEEVRVEVKEGDEWVRIPVTLCELHINKDGPADITRTAKVKFPAEWDGKDITQYINGLKPSEEVGGENPPYDEARVWFYDHEDDTYQITHYGYVGGVGPASETGVNKMWIYDPADLMRRIQVSKSFGEPTIAQVLDFVERGTDDNGRDVGLENRSVFDNIKTYIAGIQEVKRQKEDTADLGGEESDGDDFVLKAELPIVGSFQLNMNDLIDDVFDYLFGSDVTNGILGGQKRFQLNRNNMVDLMDWFADEIGGKWHFEPTPEGPCLFFDNTSAKESENRIWNDDEDEDEIFESDEDGDFARRKFVDDELVSENMADQVGQDVSNFRNRNTFTTVDVLNNNALYDIKPFNTLKLAGESTTFRQRYGGYEGTAAGANYSQSGSPGAYTEKFPWVKVTYPPLVERAGGYEYSAPLVESDKIYLDQAVEKAKKEFARHLEEESEGSIEIRGEPYILPYDHIRTIPHCNDTFPNADIKPITYEVNSVTHRRAAGERYKTELGVSLTFDESLLEVESEYRKA